MSISTATKSILYKQRVLPSQYTWPNPFKIMEFNELLKGHCFKKSDMVLDFGCGGGRQSVLLARRAGKVVGVDIDEKEIARAKDYAKYVGVENAEFYHTALEKAGLPSESFDAVVSFCVMEHVPNYRSVLKDFYRLLKPGGKIFLSVDALETITDPAILEKHAREGSVVQYFHQDSLVTLLAGEGFGEVSVRPIFQSEYARRLFESSVRKEWKGFRRDYKFLQYGRLLWEEWRARSRQKGIFLCISAVKPT